MFTNYIYMAICFYTPGDLNAHILQWNKYNEFYKFNLFSMLMHQFIPEFLLLYIVICTKIVKVYFLNVNFEKSCPNSSL